MLAHIVPPFCFGCNNFKQLLLFVLGMHKPNSNNTNNKYHDNHLDLEFKAHNNGSQQ